MSGENGLQVLNANGTVRLTVTETLHRLVATGSVPGPGPYKSVDVSWSGMTATDEWFILVVGDAIAFPGAGKFTIVCYDMALNWPLYYSVYRR